jgi:predicted nucleic acid-binding protein
MTELKKGSVLFTDVLNLTHTFVDTSDTVNLARARDNVHTFAAAARASDVTVRIFIDSSIATNEALRLWTNRRAEEVRNGKKFLPNNWSVIFGDMFVEEGISVAYSLHSDLDDLLAHAAHHHGEGAVVLSQDKDFFRYRSPSGGPVSYSRCNAFLVKGGRLFLHPWRHLQPHQQVPTDRTLPALDDAKAPKGASATPMVEFDSGSDDVAESNSRRYMYRRGAVSPCIRALNSQPFQTARSLRRAVYTYATQTPEFAPLVFPGPLAPVSVCPMDAALATAPEPMPAPGADGDPSDANATDNDPTDADDGFEGGFLARLTRMSLAPAPSKPPPTQVAPSKPPPAAVRTEREAHLKAAPETAPQVVVTEIYPYWDSVNARMMWASDRVTPFNLADSSEAEEYAASLALVRGDIDAAFAAVFPVEASTAAAPTNTSPPISQLDWRKHRFSCRSLIAELHVLFSRSSLYDAVKDYKP